MSVLQAIVLGIVQGITEFLPVSSSGHLVVFPSLFGWELQDVTFDVAVHVATLAAIVVYFRNELWAAFKGIFFPTEAAYKYLGWGLVLGTVPVVVFGLAIRSTHDVLRQPEVVIGSLFLWGVVLIIADHVAEKRKNAVTDLKQLTVKQAVWIGVAQAVALIPGTSRSGITITAGLFSGLDRKAAARFAFLLGVPAIFLAGLNTGIEMVTTDALVVDWTPLIVGFIAAFLSGWAAITLLLKLLEKVGYQVFGWYRIVLAVVLFFVL